MSKLFKNQTALIIFLETEINLTEATTKKIRYKTPGDTGDSWTATGDTIDGGDTNKGMIFYTIGDSEDLNQTGNWTFWPYVVFSDGSYAAGDPAQLEIHQEGS